jgi:putative hemolysin
MTARFALVAVCVAMLAACAGPYGREVPNIPAEGLRILGWGNPHLAWCQEAGAELVRRPGPDGKDVGTCLFPNGAECDAERTARGLCPPDAVGIRPRK